MKKIYNLIVFILIILAVISFYYINVKNYEIQNEIRMNVVNHPEYLPTIETAKNTSFGFKNIKADMYWIETIQYIGGNAISSEYKKYLYLIIDLITELNPYFEHPYYIGQLLLPGYNQRYEDLSIEVQEKNIADAVKLGLKGIKNFCDLEKLELINNESDLQKIWTEDKYKNPCSSFKVPYYLAYIYYHYKKDPETASFYYKVTSAIDDSISGSKVMAAIMSGKGGDREKAYFMFLNIAQYTAEEDLVCSKFSEKLQQIGVSIFINKSVELNSDIIKNVALARSDILGDYDENDILSDNQCSSYLNKATRELNLEYIERADIKYKADNGESSKNAKELFEKGYIDYLPIDFQQEKNYGVIYKYNEEVGNYDYSMGRY